MFLVCPSVRPMVGSSQRSPAPPVDMLVSLSKTLTSKLLLMGVVSRCYQRVYVNKSQTVKLVWKVFTRSITCAMLLFLCVAGVPGGNGRGQILQPEAWRRQNSRHQAEQEG